VCNATRLHHSFTLIALCFIRSASVSILDSPFALIRSESIGKTFRALPVTHSSLRLGMLQRKPAARGTPSRSLRGPTWPLCVVLAVVQLFVVVPVVRYVSLKQLEANTSPEPLQQLGGSHSPGADAPSPRQPGLQEAKNSSETHADSNRRGYWEQAFVDDFVIAVFTDSARWELVIANRQWRKVCVAWQASCAAFLARCLRTTLASAASQLPHCLPQVTSLPLGLYTRRCDTLFAHVNLLIGPHYRLRLHTSHAVHIQRYFESLSSCLPERSGATPSGRTDAPPHHPQH
jgi:hypothetical protein